MSQNGSQIVEARGVLTHQILAFLIIGSLGFCLDAALTISLVQIGVRPLLARPPSFVIVSLINFSLNRAFTFRSAKTRWLTALARYALVCLSGVALNYSIYAACVELSPSVGIPISPATLALFVACGTSVTALLTFVGFRTYAFRD